MTITDGNINKVLLITWIFIASLYMGHTSIDHCGNDFWGHVDYTKIIVTQHRFPTPYEGWQTYHPPFYHFLNSFILPESFLNGDINKHVKFVKYMSVFYGAIILLIISFFLKKINVNPFHRILVLLFIATTPKFVFVFTTYNNDVMLALLTTLMFWASYLLYNEWSNNKALALFLISCAALFTKYTALVPLTAVISVILFTLLKAGSFKTKQIKIILILLASLIPFSALVFFHNKPHTGKYFPSNSDNVIANYKLETILPLVKTISPTAIFENLNKKWSTPYNYTYGHESTKKYDFWSYIFLMSISQGGVFQEPDVKILWIMIIMHFIIGIVSLREIFRTKYTKLASFIIFSAYLSTMVFFIGFHGRQSFEVYQHDNVVIHFRHIIWCVIGWAALYVSALNNYSKQFREILIGTLIIGIIAQVYFLATVVGCSAG